MNVSLFRTLIVATTTLAAGMFSKPAIAQSVQNQQASPARQIQRQTSNAAPTARNAAATADETAELPDRPAPKPIQPDTVKGPLIQLAILLDNSGSMSGLIEQAKSELWRVVNELTGAKQNGEQPRLHVALYTYGNPPPTQLSPMTDDLDFISEALFAVRISGGSEYCGQVIQTATRELTWSDDPNDLKVIFIAGNEPFSQGPVDYRRACKDAIEKGIVVNTIHCGGGIPSDWRDGALLADGKAMNIDQNATVAYIEAPQDEEISKLNEELNQTYVAYGERGKAAERNQMAQDANAARQSAGSVIQRAVTKANAFYRNSSWDLVDAVTKGRVDLAKVEKESLPENMREMTPEQREAYLNEKAAKRKDLQQRINTLNSQRKQHIARQRKEMARDADERTLDRAMVDAIRTQAAERRFEFQD
ncbi:MAG: vWA domain-containing protein [Pirellulaceae bacterium]